MTTLINKDGFFDRAAMLLSGICLVHCLATAVLLALLASAGGALLDPIIHEIGLVIAVLLGMVALGRGIMAHGFMMPAAIGALGLGVMLGALGMGHDGTEVLFTVIGVALLALGHDLNYRATH